MARVKGEWPRRCTAAMVAGVFGVSAQAVGMWDCPRNRDRTYDLAAVVKWREAKLAEEAEKRSGKAEKGGKAMESRREAEAHMAWMDLGERCGLLVRKEDVDAQVRRAFLTCRTQLYRLPGIVAAAAAEKPAAECEEVTHRAVDEVLRQLEVATKKIGGRVPEEDELEELEEAT